MRSFKIGFQLQTVALVHMSKTQIQKKEKDSLKMIFDALDEEKDGEIELKEFVMQLKDKFDMHHFIKDETLGSFLVHIAQQSEKNNAYQ